MIRSLIMLTSISILACGCASTPEERWRDYTDEELNNLLGEQFIAPEDCTTPEYCESLYPHQDGHRRDAQGRDHFGWDEETIRINNARMDCDSYSCAKYEGLFRSRQIDIMAELARRSEFRSQQPAP